MLNLWPSVARRVVVDIDFGIVIAHEFIRGCSKSGLYRALPIGASRIRTIILADPSVPASINICVVDADVLEYNYDGSDEALEVAMVLVVKSKTKKRKKEKGEPEEEAGVLEWLDWTLDDWRRALEEPHDETPMLVADATPADRFQNEKEKLFAKPKHHLLTHTLASIHCEGCVWRKRDISRTMAGILIAMTTKT